MKQVIEKLSYEFSEEAKASPRMLEDLAAMEKYMAESYDGRTFIELIQNADDANAKAISVFDCGDDFVVANDGRPFDENDIIAICRSGASHKQRGDSIGYRGVGFKSTTSISDEIIIYSANEYFTFSKKLCAECLGLPENKVPIIRIPFLYDVKYLKTELLSEIEKKKKEGFTTFFIFKNGKKGKFKSELEGVNADWLLFLSSLVRITIDFDGIKKDIQISREIITENECTVKILSSDECWYLITDSRVTAAFRYDRNRIVPCGSKEGVFHCFLPTTDLTGFSFKLNADFSTDPSRKHIIKDDATIQLLQEAENILTKFVEKIAINKQEDMYPAITLLYNFSSLNDYAIEFRNNLYRKLSDIAWVRAEDNQLIKPKNVRVLPDWLNDGEKNEIVKILGISSSTVLHQMILQIEDLKNILLSLGAQVFTNDDLLKILSNYNYCSSLSINTNAKIFSCCIRGRNYDKKVLDEVYVPMKDYFQRLQNTSEAEEINPQYIQTMLDFLSFDEIKALADIYPVFNSLVSTEKKRHSNRLKQLSSSDKKTKLAINKWKKPIQNCLASETILGYSAKDVSSKEAAYHVISTSSSGEKRYIAVKQVPRFGDSFTISEAEYEAAQRLGDEYWIFLITASTDDVEYGYIENPYSVLQLERKVKEWEWSCSNYSVTDSSEKKQTTDLIDEDILNNLSRDFFNTEHLDFLNKLLSDGETDTGERRAVIAKQINSIADFYTGREILLIDNSRISIIQSLIPTLKQLMK